MLKLYDNFFLKHPVAALFFSFIIVAGFASQIPKFKLDASPDSLILENDQSLRFFREINSQYGSNDYLVLSYTSKSDLFSDASLSKLKDLRDQITALDEINSVVTILDVPLLFSPKLPLDKLDTPNTLASPGINKDLAKKEFLENPIYSKQLLSPDGQTTALLINLPVDHELRKLLSRRTELRGKKHNNIITNLESQELTEVSAKYRIDATNRMQKQNINVESIREILKSHQNHATLFLGGVPMIIADMISYIRNDLIIFSLGVLIFLIITLATIFKKKRWVFLPMICCISAGTTMMGYLGMMDWRVTVISSNFISLMLIITMSLTIHLIVRYRELCGLMPTADQRTLLLETVRLKVVPCLYTTLTTIVAFFSLLVSSIRPVMDFGIMMTIGLITSFVLAFAIFPSAAMLIKRENISVKKSQKKPFTSKFAKITDLHGNKVLFISIILAILSVVGISKLVVENRFIDYFRESTEIHQGMKLIDKKLGGTTPFDIIINLADDNINSPDKSVTDSTSLSEDNDLLNDDLLDDDFLDDDLLDDDLLDDDLLDEDTMLGFDEDLSADRFWFTSYKMEQIAKIHSFLDDQPETGKVLSLDTMIEIATALNNDIPLDDYELAILYSKLPADIKNLLITPYVSIPNNQIRITTRIMETDKNLQRQKFINRIRDFLVNDMEFSNDQINFTNMLVLYNNMLQSLFRSQILTIGVVFLGIMIMFLVLFRSVSLAFIAIIPNLLPAGMVLGSMGWFNIPLDMMTITIAAITIGIAVDNSIHYVHRFKKEFQKDKNYLNTMYRCHASIGKAMFYTSLTIIIGFSILAMSNFIPTAYFGLFTSFGMLTALFAALTLLPQLIIFFKPLGPEA